MLWLSSGKASYSFELQSNLTCKFTVTLHYFCETYSSWLVTSIAFERFLAIYFPIFQRSINKLKFAKITVTYILIFSVLTSLPSIWISRLTTMWVNDEVICTPITNEEIIQYLVISYCSTLNAYLYPGICQVLLSILISARMFMDSQSRLRPSGRLNINESARIRLSKKELTAAFTIGLIAFIDFLNTAPISIFWVVYFTGNIFAFWSLQETFLLLSLGRLLLLLTIFKRGWNFFIFLYKIPNFKEEIISFFLLRHTRFFRDRNPIRNNFELNELN